MTLGRRSLIAAAAALLPMAAGAAPRRKKAPKGCVGRVAYAGAPLRAQLGVWQFDAAARAGSSRLAPVTSDALESRFEAAAAKMQATALTAALATADGSIWTQTRFGKPGDPQPARFYWSSVAKAYTATAIMQMVDEGKLALDAPLSRWAPDAPNGAWMTIEDLLSHTGGLFSFQADPALGAEPGYKPPERLLAIGHAKAPAFCPGGNWSYSDTGYFHLGRIIEAVDGKPWPHALKARIVDRLELKETDILEPQKTPASFAAPGTASGSRDDVTTPYAAGALAASAGDVVKFWRALMSNRLHRVETTRRRFTRLYPMTGVGPSHYGLGVMVSDLAAVDPGATDVWLGHAGGVPGAKAVVAYSIEKQTFVAVALTGEGSPEATARLLLSGLPKKT